MSETPNMIIFRRWFYKSWLYHTFKNPMNYNFKFYLLHLFYHFTYNIRYKLAIKKSKTNPDCYYDSKCFLDYNYNGLDIFNNQIIDLKYKSKFEHYDGKGIMGIPDNID